MPERRPSTDRVYRGCELLVSLLRSQTAPPRHRPHEDIRQRLPVVFRIRRITRQFPKTTITTAVVCSASRFSIGGSTWPKSNSVPSLLNVSTGVFPTQRPSVRRLLRGNAIGMRMTRPSIGNSPPTMHASNYGSYIQQIMIEAALVVRSEIGHLPARFNPGLQEVSVLWLRE